MKRLQACGSQPQRGSVFEKQDLRRVVDTLPPGPVVLIGTSVGAAVALQEAADDRRVSAVVAAETFSDLRTVATVRAPAILTKGTIDRAFALAERQASFRVDPNSCFWCPAPATTVRCAADVWEQIDRWVDQIIPRSR